MSDNDGINRELAQSILEHAEAIARLDAGRMQGAAYEAACADHIAAMRSLAAPHMDPQPDLALVRMLKSLAGNFTGVFVQLVDGAPRLTIDAAGGQRNVQLLNRKQLEKVQEEDEFGDWRR